MLTRLFPRFSMMGKMARAPLARIPQRRALSASSKCQKSCRETELIKQMTPEEQEMYFKGHMDHWPVPCEPWAQGFARKNGRDNMMLAGGLAVFLGTIFVAYVYDPNIFWINLIPKRLLSNPPCFTMEEMEEEAMAELEAIEEEYGCNKKPDPCCGKGPKSQGGCQR